MGNFREDFDRLLKLPPSATRTQRQARGRDFEVVLNALLTQERLDPRMRYRPSGEEIDGSFVFGGHTYLLEAKWQQDSLPASTLYAFKGKVDGKLQGTIGVFISMSGYSKEAIEALTRGKVLNLILFDAVDMCACFKEGHAFGNLLARKLRACAEEGVIYTPSFVTQVAGIGSAGGVTLHEQEVSSASFFGGPRSVIVVCEGRIDAFVLEHLTNQVLRELNAQGRVTFFPGGGKAPLPRLANIAGYSSPGAAIIVVADSDGDPEATLNMVRAGLSVPADLVIAHPSLEQDWLDITTGRRNRREIQKQLANTSVSQLRLTSESFASYVASLLKHLVGDTATA